MKFKEGMSTIEKLSALQRMILVHSNLYYEHDTNLISDKKYDAICKLVVRQKEKYSKSWLKTDYYYCFYDFTGETGFHLKDRMTKKDRKRIEQISQYLLSIRK